MVTAKGSWEIYRHHFAVLNLVRRGGSLVTVAYRITDAARGCGTRANVPDVALTFGSVADAELVTGHVVAHPKSFAYDERLELRVTQRRCAFLLEVGHRRAGGRILARLGARGVPDGRTPGALLACERHHVGRWNPGLHRLNKGPARRGDFQHARVVERMQAGIELGIGPDGFEFRRAHGVGVGGFLQVHGALDSRYSARPLVGLAVAGPDHVEDLLEALSVLGPAFDDLDAVKIAGSRVFHRPDHERRSRALHRKAGRRPWERRSHTTDAPSPWRSRGRCCSPNRQRSAL